MDPNIKRYRAYTKWLESLPQAEEVGTHCASGTIYDEPIFLIGARKYLLGVTGEETEASVIATLPQGNLLKARVFEPFHEPLKRPHRTRGEEGRLHQTKE
jgi:hypothetical protein